MALIDLGTLRNIWKDVSDWVRGINSYKPSVKVPDTVHVFPVGANSCVSKKITVPTSNGVVPLEDTPVASGAYFAADSSNSGLIYIFPISSDSTQVVPLGAGDSIFWPVNNLDLLAVTSNAANQAVYVWGVNNAPQVD
jgi:hypothetical protein